MKFAHLLQPCSSLPSPKRPSFCPSQRTRGAHICCAQRLCAQRFAVLALEKKKAVRETLCEKQGQRDSKDTGPRKRPVLQKKMGESVRFAPRDARVCSGASGPGAQKNHSSVIRGRAVSGPASSASTSSTGLRAFTTITPAWGQASPGHRTPVLAANTPS